MFKALSKIFVQYVHLEIISFCLKNKVNAISTFIIFKTIQKVKFSKMYCSMVLFSVKLILKQIVKRSQFLQKGESNLFLKFDL